MVDEDSNMDGAAYSSAAACQFEAEDSGGGMELAYGRALSSSLVMCTVAVKKNEN